MEVSIGHKRPSVGDNAAASARHRKKHKRRHRVSVDDGPEGLPQMSVPVDLYTAYVCPQAREAQVSRVTGLCDSSVSLVSDYVGRTLGEQVNAIAVTQHTSAVVPVTPCAEAAVKEHGGGGVFDRSVTYDAAKGVQSYLSLFRTMALNGRRRFCAVDRSVDGVNAHGRLVLFQLLHAWGFQVSIDDDCTWITWCDKKLNSVNPESHLCCEFTRLVRAFYLRSLKNEVTLSILRGCSAFRVAREYKPVFQDFQRQEPALRFTPSLESDSDSDSDDSDDEHCSRTLSFPKSVPYRCDDLSLCSIAPQHESECSVM